MSTAMKYVAGIIVLAILIIGGAYFYKQYYQKPIDKPAVKQSSQPQKLSTPAPVSSNSSAQSLHNLTEQEKAALKPPQENDSAAIKDVYNKLVQSIAKEGDSLTINQCYGNPVVLRVKIGQNLLIKNSDDKDHTITLDKNVKVVIPASGSKSVVLDFLKPGFARGYSCDSQSTLNGLLVP